MTHITEENANLEVKVLETSEFVVLYILPVSLGPGIPGKDPRGEGCRLLLEKAQGDSGMSTLAQSHRARGTEPRPHSRPPTWLRSLPEHGCALTAVRAWACLPVANIKDLP